MLASWLVFAHVPDALAWVGIGVISGCGATSAWLNVRAAAAKTRHAAMPLPAGAD